MNKYLLNNVIIHSSSLNELKTLFSNILLKKDTNVLITTFNLDFLRLTYTNDDFKNICNQALYNFPDGFGITSLIKLKYNSKIERITGNDIFPILLNIAQTNHYKIAIIGGNNVVAKITKSKLLKEYGLQEKELLLLTPSYQFEQNYNLNNKIITKVIQFKPDIVFAALGCPRQEMWLFENMKRFNSKINIGIGATLDFFSGNKKRAPVLMQNIGLEWFWRLLNEPKRLFKRYLINDLPFYFKLYLKTIFNKNSA